MDHELGYAWMAAVNDSNVGAIQVLGPVAGGYRLFEWTIGLGGVASAESVQYQVFVTPGRPDDVASASVGLPVITAFLRPNNESFRVANVTTGLRDLATWKVWSSIVTPRGGAWVSVYYRVTTIGNANFFISVRAVRVGSRRGGDGRSEADLGGGDGGDVLSALSAAARRELGG